MKIALLLISLLCSPAIACALDWKICSRELAGIRRLSGEAENLSDRLLDIYDDIMHHRNEEEQCKLGGRNPLYCEDVQLRTNALLGEYKDGRSAFKIKMQQIDGHLRSIKEACGYELTSGKLPQ